MDLFTSFQPGFENIVSQEILRQYPGSQKLEELKGWQIFRCPTFQSFEDFENPPSKFCRTWGQYLGSDPTPWLRPELKEILINTPFQLHAWSRRTDLPGAREKRTTLIDVELREDLVRQQILDAGLRLLAKNQSATNGLVLNLIRLQPNQWRWGLHHENAERLPYPGGEFPWPNLKIPSRAYVKCQEAIAWTRAPLMPGQLAIDLGCAPGGAMLALMHQGLNVHGVDPAEIASEVYDYALAQGRELIHLKTHAEKLDPQQFSENARWLFSDMNVPPDDLIGLITAWAPTLRARGMQGLFLTLKLTRLEYAEKLHELPQYCQKKWGFQEVRLRQLSQNRREILLYAGSPTSPLLF